MSKERGEALREKILLAASEMFQNLGFKGTSMRALADKLEVTPPVIYYYFQSKEDLHFACVQGSLNKLETESRSLGAVYGGDIRQRFAATVRALFNWQLSHRVESMLPGAAEGARDLEMSKKYRAIKRLQRNALSRLKELIEQGRDEGVFDPVDPTVTAFAIIGMGAHIPLWAQKNGRLTLDEIVELHTTLAMRVVGTKTSVRRLSRAEPARAAPVSAPSRRRTAARPRSR